LQGNLKQIKAGYGHTKLLLEAGEAGAALALAAGLRKTDDASVFALPEQNADAVCEALLRNMLEQGIMPAKFVLREPTLHEIFIEKVGEVQS
jgi:ABC-2 type transport system ATP-binding protein